MSKRLAAGFIALTFLVTIPIATNFASQKRSRSARNRSAKVELKLRKLYLELLRASRAKDEKALRKVLADDYTQVTGDARQRSKDMRIEETLDPNTTVETADLKEFKVRVYGSAAIAVCKVTGAGVSKGQKFQYEVVSTATFIKRQGGWKIAATHLSDVKPNPA